MLLKNVNNDLSTLERSQQKHLDGVDDMTISALKFYEQLIKQLADAADKRPFRISQCLSKLASTHSTAQGGDNFDQHKAYEECVSEAVPFEDWCGKTYRSVRRYVINKDVTIAIIGPPPPCSTYVSSFPSWVQDIPGAQAVIDVHEALREADEEIMYSIWDSIDKICEQFEASHL